MMRNVLVIVVFSLCTIESGAQVKIIEMAKDSILCTADSQSVDSVNEKVRLEKIFNLRTAQRIHQFDNAISLIGNTSDSIKVAYYKHLIIALFDIDTKVIMRRKQMVDSIDLNVFVDNVANRKIKLKSLDSIKVPKWNYELVKRNVSDSVSSKSEMIPFKRQLKFSNREDSLTIIREDTEDGIEWVPKLGDMVVTLKKYKKGKLK